MRRRRNFNREPHEAKASFDCKYARLEPTTDEAIRKQYPEAAKQKFDVQLYDDEQATKPYARYSWFHFNKPKKNQKCAIVNCYRWHLVWIP